MRPDGVIFDFDGVLVDSEPMHEWAIAESVKDRGWTFSKQQFVEHIVGKGDESAYVNIARWNGATISEDEIGALLRVKWALMERGIVEGRFSVQPGAIECVRAAAARGPVGVCSGSVRSTVEPMLKVIGVHGLLGVIVTADDVAQSKPDPEGYRKAAAALGLDPRRTIAIEDTPTGIAAGKAAGLFVIGVAHTVPAERLHQADQVYTRIADVRWG